MNAITDTTRYLEDILSTHVQAEMVPEAALRQLPLLIRTEYDFTRIRLFGTLLTLAVRKPVCPPPTPAQALAHLNQIRQALPDGPAALVLPELAAFIRKRLIEHGVPFIVPGRHMFMPMLFVDLRERFDRAAPRAQKHISWAGQVVIIHQLIKKPGDMALGELARRLGYSPMTLTNTAMELSTLGICDVITQGRSRHLHFFAQGNELWEQTRERLRSPVARMSWLASPAELAGALPAGMTALAACTMISDDPVKTVCLRDRDYHRQLEAGKLIVTPDSHNAVLRVEQWKYDPQIMADGECVDRLSLYLSLKDSGDPRVDKALGEMLRSQAW